jgi:DNA-binding transcriptional MerR regulator/methylmalonyl-CoA mutase cobalamin-binding subunit
VIDTRDAPIYNIKAVARLTGVAADTLRRWESRYNILSPQRSHGNYRMYSSRDVETIRWLKARVDEGLTISRACELLRTAGPDLAAPAAPALLAERPTGVRSLTTLAGELLDYLGRMLEAPASTLLTEALGLYTVEQVIEDLLYPLLVEVGERWMSGEWTVAQEHFASAFVRGRLTTLLHNSPSNAGGALVLVACAPEEQHEIGALILALYLRRSGFRVVYLGQNLPLDSLLAMIRNLRPAAVCVSASRGDTAANLRTLAGDFDRLAEDLGYRPLLGYGGAIFTRHPELAGQMGALFLGQTPGEAVAQVRTLAPVA